MSDLEIARDLVRMGVPLFVAPACPDPARCDRGSHMDGRWHLPSRWQTSTPTADVINRWRPGWALCAVTGYAYDVIDIDPRNAGDLKIARALVSYGMVATPSGGLHIYVPSLGYPTRSGILPGVDYKAGTPEGGRGFVFIPPTNRASQVTDKIHPYVWVRAPRRPARGAIEPSTGFLRRLLERTNDAPTQEIAKPAENPPPPGYLDGFWRDVAVYEDSPPGSNGDTVLFRLVCRVREFANAGWVDLDEALASINEARRRRWAFNGEGQTDSDWARITRSALARVGDKAAVRDDPDDFLVGGVPLREHALTPVAQNGNGHVEQLTSGRLRLRQLSTVDIKAVRWLWHDRIPLGEITMVVGREGLGKSTYLCDLAAKITKGTALGEYEGTARSVIYIAQEDSLAHTVVPRLMAAGADMSKVYAVEATENDAGITLPHDVEAVAELAKRADAAAIMCDPIISLVDARLSTDRARELRVALEPLRRAAEATDASVIALGHFNKNEGDVLTKVAGSRGWVEVARAVVGLARGDGEHVPEDQIVLTQIKNNLGRLDLSNWTFNIVGHRLTTSEGKATEVGRIEWLSKVDTTVHDLLGKGGSKSGGGGRTGRPRSREGDGISAWVSHEAINRGAMIARHEIESHFEHVGLSKSTVTRRLREAVESGMLEKKYGLYGAVGQNSKSAGYPPSSD